MYAMNNLVWVCWIGLVWLNLLMLCFDLVGLVVSVYIFFSLVWFCMIGFIKFGLWFGLVGFDIFLLGLAKQDLVWSGLVWFGIRWMEKSKRPLTLSVDWPEIVIAPWIQTISNHQGSEERQKKNVLVFEPLRSAPPPLNPTWTYFFVHLIIW